MEILRSVLRELPEFQQLLAALDGGQSPVAVSGLAAVHRPTSPPAWGRRAAARW